VPGRQRLPLHLDSMAGSRAPVLTSGWPIVAPRLEQGPGAVSRCQIIRVQQAVEAVRRRWSEKERYRGAYRQSSLVNGETPRLFADVTARPETELMPQETQRRWKRIAHAVHTCSIAAT
jgi:hypothetical protein